MSSGYKEERYLRINRQLEKLFHDAADPVSRMSTINALLYHKMQDFFWVGFYLLKEGELRVGPYQGPLACLVLAKNKGVCWTSILQERTIIVPDVEKFPGHIACDPRSRSEIAVPVRKNTSEILGVLDIDSRKTGCFDEIDAKCLEEILHWVWV